MKTKAKTKTPVKTARRPKKAPKPVAAASTPARTVPRCSRCGSRTVRLEQLNQELLAVLTVHCLICGHHSFIGKPVVRLIRKPVIPVNQDLQKAPVKN